MTILRKNANIIIGTLLNVRNLDGGEDMIGRQIDAAMLRADFDELIDHVVVADVYMERFIEGCVGIVGDRIAYVGPREGARAKHVTDGSGMYLLPGFVDAHMHFESSMLTPDHFARVALSLGTTTVCADPHEICNVLGVDGVRMLIGYTEGLPFRALVSAPSTVPSAPGLEHSGFEMNAAEVWELLQDPRITGLGEVMDFHGVAAGNEKMVSILEKARAAGKLTDGHASLLTGRGLQAFRAAGIDSDHTVRTPEKLVEELSLGFCVQLQGSTLTPEMVQTVASAPAQENICLVTDDVSLPVLMEQGQLNAVYTKAVKMGLLPIKALKYTTLNPARRLRLYDTGAIAPGMKADLQLVKDPECPVPVKVWFSGETVYEQDHVFLPVGKAENGKHSAMANTVRLAKRFTPSDFVLSACGDEVTANVIHSEEGTSLTRRVRKRLRVSPDGTVQTEGLMRMAVINRYGRRSSGMALLDGFPNFQGAISLTYGHDCHNLTIYGTSPDDMALAAAALAESGGGLCAVLDGKILEQIPLPVAGLISPEPAEKLYAALKRFLECCRDMGLEREDLLMFLTLMPLAVSPEIKCTDMGLLDVKNHRLLPLLEYDEKDADA